MRSNASTPFHPSNLAGNQFRLLLDQLEECHVLVGLVDTWGRKRRDWWSCPVSNDRWPGYSAVLTTWHLFEVAATLVVPLFLEAAKQHLYMVYALGCVLSNVVGSVATICSRCSWVTGDGPWTSTPTEMGWVCETASSAYCDVPLEVLTTRTSLPCASGEVAKTDPSSSFRRLSRSVMFLGGARKQEVGAVALYDGWRALPLPLPLLPHVRGLAAACP